MSKLIGTLDRFLHYLDRKKLKNIYLSFINRYGQYMDMAQHD